VVVIQLERRVLVIIIIHSFEEKSKKHKPTDPTNPSQSQNEARKSKLLDTQAQQSNNYI